MEVHVHLTNAFPSGIANRRITFGYNLSIISHILVFFFWFEAATQLARRVQPKRTQVVCRNKVCRSRLAQRHSRNGPRTYENSFDVYIHIFFSSRHSHTQTYKQQRKRTKHRWTITELFFWFLVCYAATQLAFQLQQTRIFIYSRHVYIFELEMVLMRSSWNICVYFMVYLFDRHRRKHTHTTPAHVNRQTEKEGAWGRLRLWQTVLKCHFLDLSGRVTKGLLRDYFT